ncbi:MAG TPA: DUF2510 domain-containing protein [Pseudonocardiaceae bacterium]|nr:DUF2510 domain-containing protein [Pseudonocardiaceae bacterium]
MGRRIDTACSNCERCANPANDGSGPARGFRNCRTCGHRLSLHVSPAAPRPTVLRVLPPLAASPAAPTPPTPPAIAPGWYADPNGRPYNRWWDGRNWTDATAPKV